MAQTRRNTRGTATNRREAAADAERTRTNRAERVPIDEDAQREEYGGFKFGAAFFGWLAATALVAMLASLVSAGGVSLALTRIEQNAGAIEGLETIGIIGGILFLAILTLAYYAGGYVAGRMARFNGATQGLGVWIIGILATALLALAGVVFGSGWNVAQQLNLPRIPVDEGTLTTGAIITLLIALAITLGAAIAGGKVGERYHRKINRAGLGR